MTRSELINLIIKKKKYKKYLEIGVNTPAQPGWNFNNIKTKIKHGVDPNEKVGADFKMTSDEFFNKHINIKYDIIFIDGLHIFEQAYRDIINSLKWLEEDGTIIVHDCNPTDKKTQVRKHVKGAWHGDVWKAILKLRTENPNIEISTVDTDEGCAVIKKGKQKLMLPKNPTDNIYTYNFFDANRKEILNLITVEEFKKNIEVTIVIKLKSGLGNQLFQYALGRSIAISNGVEVKFDLSWFKQFPNRKYELDKFNIKIEFANFWKIIKVRKFKRKDGRRYLPFNFLRKKEAIHIEEKEYTFQPEILQLKESSYLDGNWQSEKYFKNIEDVIRKEITLKEKTGENFNRIEGKIKNSNSVSLHVRRGDYITEKVQQVLKLCSLDYYNKAVQIIKEKVTNPTFFIFSDDINWVKENLKTNSPTVFVSGGKLKDYEELILMGKCQHDIIANSSFSWWGAWLNNNPTKIVITPEKWFEDTSKNTKDLIPEDWLKI